MKLRGIRIELGEIEAVLWPNTRQCEKRWSSSVRMSLGIHGSSHTSSRLNASGPYDQGVAPFSCEKAPHGNGTCNVCDVEALPLTPSGKIDRRALPMPGPGPALEDALCRAA